MLIDRFGVAVEELPDSAVALVQHLAALDDDDGVRHADDVDEVEDLIGLNDYYEIEAKTVEARQAKDRKS